MKLRHLFWELICHSSLRFRALVSSGGWILVLGCAREVKTGFGLTDGCDIGASGALFDVLLLGVLSNLIANLQLRGLAFLPQCDGIAVKGDDAAIENQRFARREQLLGFSCKGGLLECLILALGEGCS